MLSNQAYEKGHLRDLVSLVSHAVFKKLSVSTNQAAYIRRMKKCIGWDKDVLDQLA